MNAIIETSGLSNQTIYFVVRNSSGQIWNGSTFVTYNSANWATYAVSMAQQSPGTYIGTFPAAITAGKYSVTAHQALSGSAVSGDPVWGGPSGFEWDGTNEISLFSIRQKTDSLPEGITKNVALNNFEFLMVSSTDHITPKTGLAVLAQRSIDGAAFASSANGPVEVSNGMYKINLAASDLNGTVITFLFSATGADARYVTIKTET